MITPIDDVTGGTIWQDAFGIVLFWVGESVEKGAFPRIYQPNLAHNLPPSS